MSHLVIAGTGRAGTSHLVRWLGEQGLDIGACPSWDERAQAGHEYRLTASADLPYVVKDPWLCTYLDDVDPAWLDVLVVPVRDLQGAAASRVRLERAAVAERSPQWSADTWGWTAGGVLVSLAEHHQAELLAVGFHHLIAWAVAHDVPLVLLDFARIGDEVYLKDRLAPWLM